MTDINDNFDIKIGSNYYYNNNPIKVLGKEEGTNFFRVKTLSPHSPNEFSSCILFVKKDLIHKNPVELKKNEYLCEEIKKNADKLQGIKEMQLKTQEAYNQLHGKLSLAKEELAEVVEQLKAKKSSLENISKQITEKEDKLLGLSTSKSNNNDSSSEEFVSLPVRLAIGLFKDSIRFECLTNAGVDNWDGIGFAYEDRDSDDIEEEARNTVLSYIRKDSPQINTGSDEGSVTIPTEKALEWITDAEYFNHVLNHPATSEALEYAFEDEGIHADIESLSKAQLQPYLKVNDSVEKSRGRKPSDSSEIQQIPPTIKTENTTMIIQNHTGTGDNVAGIWKVKGIC